MAVERSMQVRLDMLVGDYVRNASTASKATEGIAKSAEKPKSALDRVGKASKEVGRTLVTAGGIGSAAIATWGVAAFAAGAAFNTLQQTADQALITVLGSAQAASAQMEELVTWSKTSPFPRQLWIEAQQMLLGFGLEADRIVPTLSAIQDGVVAVGGSAQSIREVVQILAQVQSTGTITAETLNQLALRGVDAATLIGDSMGRTAAQIREDVSSNAIDAQTFLTTLTDSLQTRFEGAAEGLRTTWVGAVDRIAGATRDIGSIMAEPFIDPQGGGAAVVWANDIADALRALEAVARPAMEVMRAQAAPAFEAASEAAGRFTAALREVDLVTVIDRLSGAAPVLAAFGGAAAAAGSSAALSAVGMGSLAAAVSPLSAGVITLAAVSPELRGALMDVLTALAPLIPPATDLAVELATLASSGAGLAGSLLSLLAPALSVLVSAITPVLQFASGLAQVLDAIPGPVLAATVGILGLVKVLMMFRSFTGSLAIAGALVGGLDAVEGSAKRASGAVGGLRNLLTGLAAGVIVAGVVALVNAFDDTADQLERVRSVTSSGLVEDLQHLADTGQATAGLKLLFGDGGDAAEAFAGKLRIMDQTWTDLSWWDTSGNETDAAAESFRTLDAAMTEMVDSGQNADTVLRNVIDAYDLTGDQVDQLLGLLPQYTAEAERQARANAEGGDAAEEHADGLASLEEQAEQTKVSLKTLADEMRAQVDPAFAAIQATRDLADAQAAYDEALEENGASSEEARSAMLDLLEAQADAASAAGELAGITSELPPEMIALAEAAGLSAADIEWLRSQFEDAQAAGENFGSAVSDINADITTSTGRMRVENALTYAGMAEDQARQIVGMKARIDELIGAGWSYEDAIRQVASESNVQTGVIESGLKDARDAGLEFSDEYTAIVKIEGTSQAERQIQAMREQLESLKDRTVDVSIRYSAQGNQPIPGGLNRPYSRGGPVGGPLGAGDVVPAVLTPGEHVWTRDEVQAMGGHDVMESMRAAALAGSSRFAMAGMPSMAPMPRPTAGAGVNIQNFNLEAVSERLDLRQVQNELMYAGAN